MLRHNNHTISATLLTWSTMYYGDPGTWNSVSGFSAQCAWCTPWRDVTCYTIWSCTEPRDCSDMNCYLDACARCRKTHLSTCIQSYGVRHRHYDEFHYKRTKDKI